MITITNQRKKSATPELNQHIDSLNWVIKVRGNNIQRPELRYLHVKEGIIMASDGGRLHAFTPAYNDLPAYSFIPDGDYEVISEGKKIILQPVDNADYPAANLIVKVLETVAGKRYTFNAPDNKDARLAVFSVFIQELYGKCGYDWVVNIRFLEDAYCGMHDKVTVYWTSTRTLIVRDAQRAAYIMPMFNNSILQEEAT